MSSLNKAMLIGRLGRDPELRYTKSGGAVANFSIATDSRWKDKEGNQQESTEWHNIVVFGRTADVVQQYLKKGRLVYVEGRLQTRDWVDNQNVKHYRTEIVANTVQFLERTEGAGGGAPGREPQDGGYDSQSEQRNPPQDGAHGDQPDQRNPPQDEAYLEDDIPF